LTPDEGSTEGRDHGFCKPVANVIKLFSAVIYTFSE
jgi:hypothetical protein